MSRGRGPDAVPVLVEINADGKPEEVSLENVHFAKAELPNAPGANDRGRAESITDVAYADGRVFVAGLSNEEFSSRLIAIPFPFSSEGFDGAAIEIYHGAHGRFETKSPIRTFVTYRIKQRAVHARGLYLHAAGQDPVSELKAGAHVKGTTIAELGNRNRPLDMIVYQKDGKDYLLMTNRQPRRDEDSHRGRGHCRKHHRAGARWRHQGPGLRNDRQPQGGRPDGPARRPARRHPGAGRGWSESRDDRAAVRAWLWPLLIARGGRGDFPRSRKLARHHCRPPERRTTYHPEVPRDWSGKPPAATRP